MFEALAEFVRDPAFFEHRSVPVAKRRGDEQGRLFFGYFLLAKQKKVTSRRAPPGIDVKAKPLQNKEQPAPESTTQTPNHSPK